MVVFRFGGVVVVFYLRCSAVGFVGGVLVVVWSGGSVLAVFRSCFRGWF